MKFNRALLLAFPVALAAGCNVAGDPSSPSQEIESDESFLAISKSESHDASPQSIRIRALPQAGNESIYLAINKKELGQRWFLSAFLEKFSQGGFEQGAGTSLGTRVVTFTPQNGKLYVFDAGDTKALSKVNDQAVVIDAYPIITDSNLTRIYPADKWIIIDPGLSLNPYSFLGDAFASGGVHFDTNVSYQQGFQILADGVEMQQIFSGIADKPLGDGTTDPNPTHANGTLTLSLRRYNVSAGFKPAPQSDRTYYFTNNSSDVTGSPATNKWNIAPGMKPIKWLISRDILATQAATGGTYDLVGAAKAGIERWNEVFGFPVFEAALAGTGERFGDDTLNVLAWDTDPSLPFAFANLRTNPNNGEIRGASVYFSSVFVQPDLFESDPAAAQVKALAFASTFAKRPAVPSMAWAGMHQAPGCSLFVGEALGSAARAAALELPNGSPLTKKQKVEEFVTHVILHEIGHTLGLRHNFKGSLVPDGAVSTSVMDYMVDEDSITLAHPGTYDTAALKHLYLAGAPPKEQFCTDEDTEHDPNCNRFDRSDDPLRKDFGPLYNQIIDLSLKNGSATILQRYLDEVSNTVAQFTRSGNNDTAATDAMSILFRRIGAPVAGPVGPGEGTAADGLNAFVLSRLFLDSPKQQGSIVGAPLATALPQAIVQLHGVLVNIDGVRSFPSRRAAIDILKKMKSDLALETLLTSRSEIAKAAGPLPDAQALLVADLLARIDAATRPYY